MEVVTWFVGASVAALFAKVVVGGTGHGPLGTIFAGAGGGVLGFCILSALRWEIPRQGLPAAILVAFVGAVPFLWLIRTVRRGRPLPW